MTAMSSMSLSLESRCGAFHSEKALLATILLKVKRTNARSPSASLAKRILLPNSSAPAAHAHRPLKAEMLTQA